MKKSVRDIVRTTQKERKRYALKEVRDYIILAKVKFLESRKLLKRDRDLIRLLRTQLERDWRKPLIKFLDKLLKKYV